MNAENNAAQVCCCCFSFNYCVLMEEMCVFETSPTGYQTYFYEFGCSYACI